MALTTVPVSLSATALTLTTAAQPNITSVGTLTGLTVSGNIAGTLTTAAQTNITSVGTLTALTMSGALTLNTGSSGVPTINLSHSNSGADNFRIMAGITGVSNSGFSIYDVDESASRLVINSDGQLSVGDGSPQWPTGTVSNSAGRHMFHYNGVSMLLLWDESTAAQGNAAQLYLGGKPVGSSNYFSGSRITGRVENGSNAAGEMLLETTNTSGGLATALTLDSSQNATFAGTISSGAITSSSHISTTGSASKFISNSSSSGDYIRIYAGSGTGKWDIYGNGANLRFSDNDSAGLVAFDTGATFGGTVTLVGSELRIQRPSGGTSYLGISMDSGEKVRFRNSWANKDIYFDRDGKVGIGVTSPDGTLHVHSGTAGTIAAAASANELVLESDGPVGMSLLFDDEANDAYGNIYWGNETDGSADGRITYFGSTYVTAADRQNMVFRTAGAERLRINSSGYVGIGATSPANYTYGDLVIDGVTGSGNASGITLVSSNTSYGGIFFADGTSGDEKYRGYLQYNHNHTSLVDMLLFGTAGGTRMVLSSAGKLGLGNTDPQGDIHLTHGSTNTFTASNDSWHTIVLHNNSAAATNTTGIAFEVSGNGYHGNAGTGIAAVKNGTNSDYGADLVFITRPQSAVAAEMMRINNLGLGIGNQNPGYPLDVTSNSSALGIRIRGRSDHIGELNFSSNNGATIYSQIQSLASELRVKAISNIPMKFYTNNNQRMTLDTNGDVTLSNGSVSTGIDQFQNNGITSTTAGNAGWTLTTNSGTFNTRGSLEVAGIANRHVFKWGFSGNLSANTWYAFAKRSELATYGPDSGGGSEDGFAMYFRIYTYASTSGWGEYLSNRLTNMVWIGNYGSNSVQEHEFIVGPGLGHAPNAGQNVDTPSSNPIRMRIHHRMGTNDHPNSDQTFEIRVSSALSGLNATVAGRQLLIYGYVL